MKLVAFYIVFACLLLSFGRLFAKSFAAPVQRSYTQLSERYDNKDENDESALPLVAAFFAKGQKRKKLRKDTCRL